MNQTLIVTVVLLIAFDFSGALSVPSFGIKDAIQRQIEAVNATKNLLHEFYNIYHSETPTSDLKDLAKKFIGGEHPSEIADNWDNITPKGEFTDLSYYPYVVSIENSLILKTRFCSGVIISPKHVLTIAQCFDPAPRDIYVRAGSSKFLKNMPGQVVRVQRVYKHPCYNYKIKRHVDIAILKLSEEFEFNDRVSPVRLPQLDHFVEKHQVGEAIAYKNELLTAPARILTQKECSKYFITSGFQFCAWAQNRTLHDCIGFSGAPFLQTLPDVSQEVLAGLVSYTGKECKRTPVVYTMIERYLPWIQAMMDMPDDAPIHDYC